MKNRKYSQEIDDQAEEMDGQADGQFSTNRQKDYDKNRLKHGKSDHSDHNEQLNIDIQNEQMEEKEDEIAKA